MAGCPARSGGGSPPSCGRAPDPGSRGAPRNTYRPPEYAVVISASDWVKEHFPANRANLWDALHPGNDPHRDPEPDLEAEP